MTRKYECYDMVMPCTTIVHTDTTRPHEAYIYFEHEAPRWNILANHVHASKKEILVRFESSIASLDVWSACIIDMDRSATPYSQRIYAVGTSMVYNEMELVK